MFQFPDSENSLIAIEPSHGSGMYCYNRTLMTKFFPEVENNNEVTWHLTNQ